MLEVPGDSYGEFKMGHGHSQTTFSDGREKFYPSLEFFNLASRRCPQALATLFSINLHLHTQRDKKTWKTITVLDLGGKSQKA